MELKDIYALWDRFERSGVSELELDYQGLHLRLKDSSDKNAVLDGSMFSEQKTEKDRISEAAKEKAQESKRTIEIHSPLVGIFYTAPAPGEKPFVQAGQNVKTGDVIGIIEAMKCMNEITAIENGIVDEIIVKNGDLVEYDQVLMKLRAAGEGNV